MSYWIILLLFLTHILVFVEVIKKSHEKMNRNLANRIECTHCMLNTNTSGGRYIFYVGFSLLHKDIAGGGNRQCDLYLSKM